MFLKNQAKSNLSVESLNQNRLKPIKMNFSFQLRIPKNDPEKEYLKTSMTKINSTAMSDEN